MAWNDDFWQKAAKNLKLYNSQITKTPYSTEEGVARLEVVVQCRLLVDAFNTPKDDDGYEALQNAHIPQER